MENLESEKSSAIADVLQNGLASHTRSHAETLARDYDIKNPEQVAEFIGENLFLLDLLEEIPAQIRKVFGEEQGLKLEFFLDPEDPNYHRLAVAIPTKAEFAESSSLLQKFDEEWWFANERKSRSKILIDLESAE